MGGFDANKDIYLYIYMALKKTIYYIYILYIHTIKYIDEPWYSLILQYM